MENSHRPTTAEFAAFLSGICDAPPTFHNLDVLRAETSKDPRIPVCSPCPARRRLGSTRSSSLDPWRQGAGLLMAFRRTIRESDVPADRTGQGKLAQALADATAGAAVLQSRFDQASFPFRCTTPASAGMPFLA